MADDSIKTQAPLKPKDAENIVFRALQPKEIEQRCLKRELPFSVQTPQDLEELERVFSKCHERMFEDTVLNGLKHNVARFAVSQANQTGIDVITEEELKFAEKIALDLANLIKGLSIGEMILISADLFASMGENKTYLKEVSSQSRVPDISEMIRALKTGQAQDTQGK